jgi:ubiquinone/menaquinone biosynthesis C-methylase UbiE
MHSHNDQIRDQFSRQAVPFSNAPGIRDEASLQLLVKESGVRPNDRVLDVACGPGLVVKAFARVAAQVTGIDLTPAMIDRAREHTRDCENVRLRLGDVTALPYPDASFSLVLSRFAFHHFPQPLRVLEEMQRVCAPGGVVMVCDLLASHEPRKAAAFHALEMLRDPSHVRALRIEELRGLFEQTRLVLRSSLITSLSFELEALIARSFPQSVDRAELRQIYHASIDDDGLGLDLQRRGDEVDGAYTVAMMVANRV